MHEPAQNAQWRMLNNNGQLVNSDGPSWDLAEGMVRLNIAPAENDPSSTANLKPSSSPAAQLTEASPLDSASNPSIDSSPQSNPQAPHSRDTSSGAADNKADQPFRPNQDNPEKQSQRLAYNGSHQDQPSYSPLSRQPQRGPLGPPAVGTLNGSPARNFKGPNSGGSYAGRGNQYRPQAPQIQVGIPQQGLAHSPTYPGASGPLSLGSPQQLYEMMISHEAQSPASRTQQQNNYARGNHQPSLSDPSSMRDPSAMGLLNNNVQSFNPPMFTPQMAGPISMYTNQYYPNQDAYRADLAAQTQAMLAARMQQQQYNGQYGGNQMGQGRGEQPLSSPGSSVGGRTPQNGPSANNRKLGLYKTELCRSWEEKHSCRYGAKCQFAHGEDELRNVQRHPKYKTEICRTFWVSGSCPYGKRCCFIHTELPNALGANNPQADHLPAPDTAPSPGQDGRPHSQGNNSEPNEAPLSLLARISGTLDSGSNSSSATPTPIDTSSTATFPASQRPVVLHIDTKSLDKQAYKTQNKSAFPIIPNGRTVHPAPEPITAKSPVPATAGPDLGRHNASRLEIVGYRNVSGTPTNGGHNYANPTEDGSFSPSTSSHQRASSGSASAWGANVPRVGSNVNYPASPSGDNITSPWTTQEVVAGAQRGPPKPW